MVKEIAGSNDGASWKLPMDLRNRRRTVQIANASSDWQLVNCRCTFGIAGASSKLPIRLRNRRCTVQIADNRKHTLEIADAPSESPAHRLICRYTYGIPGATSELPAHLRSRRVYSGGRGSGKLKISISVRKNLTLLW